MDRLIAGREFYERLVARVAYGNDRRQGGSRDVSMLWSTKAASPCIITPHEWKFRYGRYSWRNAFHFFPLLFLLSFRSFSSLLLSFRRARGAKRLDRSSSSSSFPVQRKSSPPRRQNTTRSTTTNFIEKDKAAITRGPSFNRAKNSLLASFDRCLRMQTNRFSNRLRFRDSLLEIGRNERKKEGKRRDREENKYNVSS